MKFLENRFIPFILKYSLHIVVVTVILTIGALFFIPKIKLDSSVDALFNKKSKSYIEFEKWKKQFGSDDIIIVAFKDDAIFSYKTLNLIDRLTQKFEVLKYVDKVRSLTNVNDIVGFEGDFIVRPLIEEIPSEAEKLKKIREQALSNPLYVKELISPDGKTTAILVQLEQSDNPNYKKETIEQIQKIIKKEFPADKPYYLTGPVAIEYFYASYMKKDLKTFLPIILGMILVLLFFSFRNIWAMLLPFLTILITLTWTMALVYFLKFSINNITTIIPPIILAIAVADSIHFLGESIQKRRGEKDISNKEGLLVETIKHLFLPCFLTSATTMIGFFSLAVSKIPPIKELGVVVGIGVGFALLVTFLFMPAAIKQFNLLNVMKRRVLVNKERERNNSEDAFSKKRGDVFFRAIGRFNERFSVLILGSTLIISILGLWGLKKIKVETSVLEYFRKRSSIYRATTFVEENLSGIHFLNVSLEAKKIDYFKYPHSLREIEKLQEFLKNIPEVDKTTSCVDYIKEINKSFHNENNNFYKIPSSKKAIAQYLLLYGASDLDDFIDSNWRWTTIRVRLKEHNTSSLKRIIDTVDSYIKTHFPHLKTEVVGETVLEVETNEAVTKGQVQSLVLAMLVIFGMMFVVFKRLGIGLISIVPNILPILINFGIMGWIGIRLNSATSMISAIGIGIIVDDTIHFLYSFRESIVSGYRYKDAMYKTLAIKGRPIVLTSLILFFGFGVVSFSRFVPTFYFGILSSLLMVNALWADLIVLPSLLLQFTPKFK